MNLTERTKNFNFQIKISAYEIIFLILHAYLYTKYLEHIANNAYTIYSSWLQFTVIALIFILSSQTLYTAKHKKSYANILFLISACFFSIWLYMDTTLFSLMGFHLNNYVIESLLHKDALKHIGISYSTIFLATWPIIFFVLPTFFAYKLSKKYSCIPFRSKHIFILFFAIITAQITDKLIYAYNFFKAEPFVFQLKNNIPGYIFLHPYHSNKIMSLLLGKEAKAAFSQRIENPGNASPSSFKYDIKQLENITINSNYNILFIIAESLRAHNINETTAPFISSLRKSNISADLHYSSSNTTHFGIFSLLYGLSPAYFHDIRISNLPSPFFKILSNSDYSFQAALSNSMDWYDIEKFTLDSFFTKHMAPDTTVIEKDKFTTGKTIDLLNNAKNGKTFILSYFYATHADYNHPQKLTLFKPELKGTINFTDPKLKENQELLLNRYRNSIYFFDQQVKSIITHLKNTSQWDKTIVVITSDHGEEFFEHNRFGHNSGLNNYQTKVPLIIHIPGISKLTISKPSSHIDLPRTILQQLQPNTTLDKLFQGGDLFETTIKPVFVGSAHYQKPQRYAIISTTQKIIVDIESGYPVIEKVTDLNDNPINYSDSEVRPLLIKLIKHITKYRNNS